MGGEANGTTAVSESEGQGGPGAVQERSGASAPAGRTALFPHVGRWSRGYSPKDVDTFFASARRAYEGPLEAALTGADVRAAAFDLTRGGYDTMAVDAALDRLEGAFVRRERAAFMAGHDQQEWMARVAERATSLYPRLVRPAGQRFAPPRRGTGYLASDVDALLDRLVDYFDKSAALTAAELRAATFATARSGLAYADGAVDAFIDRAVEVLLAVE